MIFKLLNTLSILFGNTLELIGKYQTTNGMSLFYHDPKTGEIYSVKVNKEKVKEIMVMPNSLIRKEKLRKEDADFFKKNGINFN